MITDKEFAAGAGATPNQIRELKRLLVSPVNADQNRASEILYNRGRSASLSFLLQAVAVIDTILLSLVCLSIWLFSRSRLYAPCFVRLAQRDEPAIFPALVAELTAPHARRSELAAQALARILHSVCSGEFAALTLPQRIDLIQYIDFCHGSKRIKSEARRIALAREILRACARCGIVEALIPTRVLYGALSATPATADLYRALRECLPALEAVKSSSKMVPPI